MTEQLPGYPEWKKTISAFEVVLSSTCCSAEGNGEYPVLHAILGIPHYPVPSIRKSDGTEFCVSSGYPEWKNNYIIRLQIVPLPFLLFC